MSLKVLRGRHTHISTDTLTTIAQDLDAKGLVALTHALAETEHESEGTGKLLAAIAAGALDLVPTFTPGQLVSLLASFSRLHHYNEPMYRAIARQAAPTVSSLQLQQQSDLLHALAVMVRVIQCRSHWLSRPSS